MNKNELQGATKKADQSMDQIPTSNSLNSDNAFNDKGLENAESLEDAMKEGKSK